MDGPPTGDGEKHEHLTPREREILALVGNGLTTREIAAALGASPLTIRKHRSNMLHKLNLSSAAALVAHATGPLDSPRPASAHQSQGLTARETEVVQLLRCGLTSKEVARRLGVSDMTVRKHRERIYRKLGVRRFPDLIARTNPRE